MPYTLSFTDLGDEDVRRLHDSYRLLASDPLLSWPQGVQRFHLQVADLLANVMRDRASGGWLKM
jgi:hypothetical protein